MNKKPKAVWRKHAEGRYERRRPEDCPKGCVRRDDWHDCRACEYDAYSRGGVKA